MDSVDFTQNIADPLADFCYLHGRHTHQREFTLHFDQPPIHNTKLSQVDQVSRAPKGDPRSRSIDADELFLR
jgi:hypothetical protein